MKIKYRLIAIAACAVLVFAGCENKNTSSGGTGTKATTNVTTTAGTTAGTNGSDTSGGTSKPNTSADTKVNTSQTAVDLKSTAVYANGAIDVFSALGGKKIQYGQGVNVDEYNRPVDAVMMQEKYGKQGGVFIGENEKKIYLTFDEGYENGFTPAILDTLKEKGAKAVFFVTYDYVKRNEELIVRMLNEGHEVGNHTWTHPSLPDCTSEKAHDEISKLHDYVKEHFDYDMKLMRPPMGEFSEETLEIASKLGYKTMLWSFAHVDWDVNNQPSEEKAYSVITEKTHNGAVYLLHAVSSANTAVLGRVIDYWRAEGYELALY